jgi:hypothetical protein
MFHSCIEKDSTKQPQLVALITDESNFTQFLWAVLYQHENLHNFQTYAIILCLIWFDIVSMWLLLSSMGRQQKMTTLSHHQSHVWIDYVSDIIMCLLQFHFQQLWLFLPPWLRCKNLYPPVHSKWKSVNFDVISWLNDITCNVRLAHSSICTVCDKGKGAAISALDYCRM